MFKFIVVCVCTTALVSGLTWSDCSTNKANNALTVHSMDLQPNPIIFPGNLSVSLNLTVNRKIDHLFLETMLVKKTPLSHDGIEIPCDNATNLGSCKSIDACSILEKVLNGSSVISADLGLQIDSILLAALGHHATCPINPETFAIKGKTVALKPLPVALSATIGDGDYTVTIKIKETSTSTDNVGCLTFDAGLRRKTDPGFLFG